MGEARCPRLDRRRRQSRYGLLPSFASASGPEGREHLVRVPVRVHAPHDLRHVPVGVDHEGGALVAVLALVDHTAMLATLLRVRRAFRDMNPTLRGFLVIALIALVVVVLQLERTLAALFILARIAFFLAIAYFLFLVWRDRRDEISMWSRRSRAVFYGSALLMVVNVAARFFTPIGTGLNLLVFIAVFAFGGFAMWRVWKDEHTYGY